MTSTPPRNISVYQRAPWKKGRQISVGGRKKSWNIVKSPGWRKHTSIEMCCCVSFPMSVKLRSRGLSDELGWISIPLFNSHFLESRHPLSFHLRVYRDTQSLAHCNQSSWLMMGMWRVCELHRGCECEFSAHVHLHVSLCVSVCLCVWFSVCTWVSRLPEKAYWWQLAKLLLPDPVWARAAEGWIGCRWRSAEPPPLVSCENDRPTHGAGQASRLPANSMTDSHCYLLHSISHELSFLFREVMGITEQTHPLYLFFLVWMHSFFKKCCSDLTCLYS